MAKSLQQTDGIISFDVLINGTKIKDTIEVYEIGIEMEVNKITAAVLVVQDGSAFDLKKESFINSEGSDFIPGNEIEIRLGYDSKRDTVFKGLIVSQQLKVKCDKSQLTVICKDKAIKMTKGRHNEIFQNKTDANVIKSIVNNYQLESEIDKTTVKHPIIIQYNCSDWDYIVLRAEANNMLVTTYQNKLSVKKIDFTKAPNFEINTHQFVIDIDLQLQSENLSTTYNMSAWNPDSQQVVNHSHTIQDSLTQGNLSAKKLSDTLNNSSNSYSSASLDTDEMKVWLESQANLAVLEKIQGEITIPGTTEIIAGDIIKLSGFSARFNGNAFISKVSHTLHDGQWLTELHVGKSAKLHAALDDVEATGASGLLPALRGAQIATVKQIHEDPDNKYRVLVTLPMNNENGEDVAIWARISIPYASADAGFFFFPEVGDEVLLTFMNNDPRFPVIIGSLYSGKNKPKETPNEQNQFKSIYSKSGINIRFDDEDKILTIETPEMNTIVLDDKNKSISIKDSNENAIVMDESGITMNSPKDITLNADGNINLTAKSNLAMKANADATLDGLKIIQNAQTSFTAKGNASAELSASGQTTLKGSIVMIN